MGQDKRGLIVAGRTLFSRALEVYEAVFSEIIVVVAEHSSITKSLPHRVLTDVIPGKGPMGGLYTGLKYSSASLVFLAACDMPFLSVSLVRKLCNLSLDSDVTMVRLATGIQPMQGVYSKKCLSVLKQMIECERLEMREIQLAQGLVTNIVPQESIQVFDKNFLSFMNVNTPSDLEMANKYCASCGE